MSRLLFSCVLLGFLVVPGLTAADNLEDINFPLNSSVVVDGFQGLDLLAEVMQKHPNLDLEVVGYTDAIGSATYNKRLSEQRANAVKLYLEGKGVSAGKIQTSGQGIDRSHDNDSREGRFQNRRVSLNLYETVNGSRSKVSYKRLLYLFFGESGAATAEGSPINFGKQDEILKKLSDLEQEVKNLKTNLGMAVGPDGNGDAPMPVSPGVGGLHGKFGFGDNYSGVSFGIGVDDDSDFTGVIEGLYFKPVGNQFALQLQGEISRFEHEDQGQFDAAFIYQHGWFKLAAAGSYKYASVDGFETARMGQGALIADINFDRGKVGLFATTAFADGDIVGEVPLDNRGAFVQEWYVNVPAQFGLNFGFSITDRVDFGGHFGAIDGETSSDLSADLKLDVLVGENLSWYLQAEMNDSHLINDDKYRYLTGLKLGSWSRVRYGTSDRVTPIEIPRVRYEILGRAVRKGNTAPVAEAGPSRSNVAAGNVVLDGSQSFDPEADAITYQWVQISGPSVDIQNAEQAVASFEGEAGATYAFQLTVRDTFGETNSDVVRIQMEEAPIPLPSVSYFRATPDTINLGGISNLSWLVNDADTVTISGLGDVSPEGVVFLSPETTTTYTLTATNVTGSVTADVTVTVNQPAGPSIGFFTATPDEIKAGEFTTLSWSTQNADTVTISGLGQVAATGTVILTPEATTTYTLEASGSGGSDTASVTVTVGPPNRPPVASAGADINIFNAQTVTLDGSLSSDPDGDTLSYQWFQISGRAATLTGAETANPSFMAESGTYVFRLVVRDTSGGVDTDDVRVTVVEFKN
ncbi:OmpA family protein [Sulfidibacter corallicola]|nr:PKD domain-containing protein [Sulfidibacter corallicola]